MIGEVIIHWPSKVRFVVKEIYVDNISVRIAPIFNEAEDSYTRIWINAVIDKDFRSLSELTRLEQELYEGPDWGSSST